MARHGSTAGAPSQGAALRSDPPSAPGFQRAVSGLRTRRAGSKSVSSDHQAEPSKRNPFWHGLPPDARSASTLPFPDAGAFNKGILFCFGFGYGRLSSLRSSPRPSPRLHARRAPRRASMLIPAPRHGAPSQGCSGTAADSRCELPERAGVAANLTNVPAPDPHTQKIFTLRRNTALAARSTAFLLRHPVTTMCLPSRRSSMQLTPARSRMSSSSGRSAAAAASSAAV